MDKFDEMAKAALAEVDATSLGQTEIASLLRRTLAPSVPGKVSVELTLAECRALRDVVAGASHCESVHDICHSSKAKLKLAVKVVEGPLLRALIEPDSAAANCCTYLPTNGSPTNSSRPEQLSHRRKDR